MRPYRFLLYHEQWEFLKILAMQAYFTGGRSYGDRLRWQR